MGPYAVELTIPHLVPTQESTPTHMHHRKPYLSQVNFIPRVRDFGFDLWRSVFTRWKKVLTKTDRVRTKREKIELNKVT